MIQVIPPRALRRGKRTVFYVGHSFAPILQSNSSEVQSCSRPGEESEESVRPHCAMHINIVHRTIFVFDVCQRRTVGLRTAKAKA